MDETDTMNPDDTFDTYTIESVTENDGWYSITFDEGMGIGVDKKYGVEPKPGQRIDIWGGFGHPARGMRIGGEMLYYRTPEQQRVHEHTKRRQQEIEQQKEFQEKKDEYDARYEALPDVFRRRIDKFRDNNPDFRWKYEPYELFTCEEAVKIAEHCGTPEAVYGFPNVPHEKQMNVISEGHSGNTFGMACRLAYLYLSDPEGVVKMHGALAPLVGSEEYGCVPPTD